MVNCKVFFINNPNGVFFSGQVVSGAIVLDNESSRKVRGILMTVNGSASTDWSEGSGDDATRYSAEEHYMKTETRLVGNGRDQMELAVGRHTLNFSFVLPPAIPSTFKHKNGKIKYQIEVQLEQHLLFNSSYKFPFVVVSHLDLNVESDELRRPLRASILKNFFLGMGSGLQLSAQIPFSGYVPGQTMHIAVSMINDSAVEVEEIFVELRRNCIFKAKGKNSLIRDNQLLVKSKHRVDSKPKVHMEVSMQIPPVEPTCDRFCKYIWLTYEVDIIAKVGMFHRNPIVKIPIVIGTVPLVGVDDQPSTSSASNVENMKNKS